MAILLTKQLKHENQAIELIVKYDVKTSTVDEVKSIWLITFGKQIPIGNLMMNFFEPAINKIIDETDWREIYREKRDDVAAVGNVFEMLNSYFIPVKKTP